MSKTEMEYASNEVLLHLLNVQRGQVVIAEPDGTVLVSHGQELMALPHGSNLFDRCVFLIGMEDKLSGIAKGENAPIELDQLVLSRPNKDAALRLKVNRYGRQDLMMLSLENSETSFASVQAQVQARNEISLANALLNEAREEAERANKAKSKFLSTITHELRTPLSIIVGNAELLEASPVIQKDEDLKQSVADIDDYTRYMLNLVGDLLDLAKAEAGKLTLSRSRVNLSELVSKLGLDLQDLAEKKDVAFELKVAETPSSMLDAIKTQQVVSNIIFNAIKFTEAKGQIKVSCGTTDSSHQTMLQFRVKDTGRGMTHAEITALGKPFTQFDRHDISGSGSRGTGLGLALVKSIIELHEGQFEIESEPGVGSEIIVRLPIV